VGYDSEGVKELISMENNPQLTDAPHVCIILREKVQAIFFPLISLAI